MVGKWYSTMSTGILEIDCQHQNLDTILSLIINSDDNEAYSMLTTFAKGISDHFQFEENFKFENGQAFVDAEHDSAHRNIEAIIENGIHHVNHCPSDIDVIAMDFSRALLSHAADYDIPASRRGKN